MNWYVAVLKKYAVFAGRASRQEYWMFTLINLVIIVAFSILSTAVGGNIGGIIYTLLFIYDLAVIIPSISVAVRRLHDTDRSGWWIFISLVPLVGWIIALVFMVLPSTAGSNKYGANPSGTAAPTQPAA